MSDTTVVTVVGFGTIGSSGMHYPDTSHARIQAHDLAAGTLVDLTDACSLLREACEVEASKQRSGAKSQLKLSKSANTRSAREMYADNDRRFRYSAELASRPSRWLPIRVERCGTDHILVGLIWQTGLMGNIGGMLRLVRVADGSIVWEEKTKPAGDAVAARSLAEFRAVSPDGRRVLMHQALAMRRFGLGLGRHKIGFGERGIGTSLSGFSELKSIKMDATSWFGSTDTHWVQAMDGDSRGRLLLIEHETGRVSEEVKLKRQPAGLGVAAGTQTIVIAGYGPAVDLVAPGTFKSTTVKPHSGLSRDWNATVSLSSDGQYVISTADNQRRVIRVADSMVAAIADQSPITLEPKDFEGLDVSVRMEPNLAIVGERLVLLDGEGLRQMPLDNLEFKAPPPKPKPIRIAKSDQPEAMCQAVGLDRSANAFVRCFYPGVTLASRRPKKRGWNGPDKGGPPLGATRLGGWPDLAPDEPWPEWEQRPMAFLAQVNLAQMHSIEPRLRLPDSGLLSFFVGCEDESYQGDHDPRECYLVNLMLGTDASHRGGWKVIYSPSVDGLERRLYDGSVLPEIFTPCEVRPRSGAQCLPNEDSALYQELALDPAERDRYNQLLSKLGGDEDARWTNQFGGFPTLIQGGDPESFCELAATGSNPYELADESTKQSAARWRLLLQLTSDSNPDFNWGDGGHIYFYGDREKTAGGDFSETWFYFEN